MKNFKAGEDAVSQVIGVILMMGLTVIMISAVAVSVFAFSVPESAPHARIVVVEAKGDTDQDLYENKITLRHKGGDCLFRNTTKIIISGKGYAYNTGSYPSPAPSARDIQVTYKDITGKNYYHDGTDFTSKEMATGISWDAGEQIELYGRDGINIGNHNQGNTVDKKWTLKAGSTVSVKIIDASTNQLITTSITIVKHS